MTELFTRGLNIATLAELRDELDSKLKTLGWTDHLNTKNTSPWVLKGNTINSVTEYVRLTWTGETLTMQGDDDGAGSTLSNATNTVFEAVAAGSKMWLSAREDAFCLAHKPSSTSGRTIFFGRPNLELADDGYAIEIVRVGSGLTSNEAFVRKPYTTAIIWDDSPNNKGQMCGNRIVGGTPTSAGSDTNALNNSVYIEEKCFRQYVTSEFRGFLPWVCNGIAHLPAGTEVTGPNGRIYVTFGTQGSFRVS